MNFPEQCRSQHQRAINLRAQRSYAQGDLPLILNIFTAQSPSGIFLRTPDDLPREVFIEGIYLLLRSIHATAAILTSDARSLNSKLFAQRFGLALDDDFSKNYCRILREQFDDTMANLPPDLRQDVLITAVKGPHCPCLMCYSTYALQGVDGVVFQPMIEYKEQTGILELNILPNWWPTTVQ